MDQQPPSTPEETAAAVARKLVADDAVKALKNMAFAAGDALSRHVQDNPQGPLATVLRSAEEATGGALSRALQAIASSKKSK